MLRSSKNSGAARGTVLILIAVLSVAGCSRDHRTSYVARVDQSVLTETDLLAAGDSSRAVRPENIEFVNDWVATELLYQEAVRRGLSDTEDIRRQLNEARRHLAINALLDQELYGKDTAVVTERAMHDLYSSGSDEFRLKEDVVLLSYVLFSDRDAANEFRSTVLRGASWHDALGHAQFDTLVGPKILQTVDRRYFTKETLYPEELWRLSRNVNKEEVSYVVAANAGFYVLIVHGVQLQGEIPEWNYIKDELRERVLIEQRKQMYENLLAHLRATHSVEVRLGLADSSAAKK